MEFEGIIDGVFHIKSHGVPWRIARVYFPMEISWAMKPGPLFCGVAKCVYINVHIYMHLFWRTENTGLETAEDDEDGMCGEC